MTYLLDTHVVIWFRASPENLGPGSIRLLENPTTSCALSAVSALEIAQLVHRGRLVLPGPTLHWFSESIARFGGPCVPLTPEIAAEAYSLPGSFHPDPADRILAATARLQGFVLLTADQRLIECPSFRTRDARA